MMFALFSLQLKAQNRTLVGEDLRDKLQRLYKDHKVYSYYNARKTIYNQVDCQDDKLWLEYSDYRYDWECGSSKMPPSTIINAEHTIPQSFFHKQTPMVSDMHHIFASPAKLNTARSNYPFGEWSYDDCRIWCYQQSCSSEKPSGDMTEYSCVNSNGNGFMPRAADRGRVARAVFYFFTMYDSYDITSVGDIETLKKWNREFPPDDREKFRNDQINQTQGNRNPFVDDYTLIDQIDW